MKPLFLLLLTVLILSCSSNKYFVDVIRRKKISVEYDSVYCIKNYSYKNIPLNGKYKIRKRVLFPRIYDIWNVKNGLFEGKYTVYKNGKPYRIIEYKKGLQDGKEIKYEDGVISWTQMYKEGLPWGSKVSYDYNGCDTSLVVDLFADKDKMDIYIDKPHINIYKTMHLCLLINACEKLKVDEYPQYFYSKKDSSLLLKRIWKRQDIGSYELKNGSLWDGFIDF